MDRQVVKGGNVRTESEWKAYNEGRADANADQKRYPGSFVVVFEEGMLPEDREAIAALFRAVRGVQAVLPVEESHHSLLHWRELVEALDADPCDDHAQEAALTVARQASAELASANRAWDAFWKMATPEQQQTILKEVYPHLGRTP